VPALETNVVEGSTPSGLPAGDVPERPPPRGGPCAGTHSSRSSRRGSHRLCEEREGTGLLDAPRDVWPLSCASAASIDASVGT
jgi:hypothetical protein